MQNIKIFLLTIVILPTIGDNLNGQYWERLWYDYPAGFRFEKIEFIDEKNGWAMGSRGELLLSKDGGLSWLDVSLDPSIVTFDFHFFNRNNGLLTSDQGIYRTTDGGNNWQLEHEALNEIEEIEFYQQDFGLAASNNGILYRSTDGGLHWDPIFDSESRLVSLKIKNEKNFVVGSGFTGDFYFTNDGGLNWKNNSRLNQPARPIKLTDDGTFWIKGYDFFIKMEADGTISDRIPCPIGNFDMISPSVGWIVNGRSEFLKTEDRGQTWNRKFFVNTRAYKFSDINFLNSTLGWVTGTDEVILRTTDGGERWTVTNIDAPTLNSVWLVNDGRGWAVGEKGLIYHNSNYRVHWEQYASPTTVDLNAIIFYDLLNGWIVGDNGMLLFTEDGGNTWEEKAINDSENNFSAIDFYNGTKGIVVGDNGSILHTENGGKQWFVLPQVSFENLNDVDIINEQLAWTVGDNGLVLKSEDGGQSWEKLGTFPGIAKLLSVAFADPKVGLITSDIGEIWRTVDSGENWMRLTTLTQNTCNEIYFLDTNRAWIACDGGEIIRTEDAGLNWTVDSLTMTSDIHAIHFLQADQGLIVGAHGMIMRSIDYLPTPAKVLDLEKEIVKIFPNPARERFHLAFKEYVLQGQLRLLDLQGRVVYQSLIRDSQAVTIEVSRFSKGIYFIEMELDGQSFFRKVSIL